MKDRWTVGIVVFGEAEVLDFSGPFEAFAVARDESGNQRFDVSLVAQEKAPIIARNGFAVVPRYSFSDAPNFDVLIVPGGYGAEEIEIHNPVLLDFLRARAKNTPIVASVCTGAFLLAEAGLLDGKSATTHWMDIDRFEREYPAIRVARDVRYVDEGAILSSAGVSSGIDMSLHLVARYLGEAAAKAAAKRMEYTPGA